MKRTLLTILFGGMSAYMAYLVYSTAQQSNLMTLKIEEPWFKTTLIDFYLNTVVLCAWVIYKERTWISRALWIIGFLCTGAVAVCLYVVVQISRVKPEEPFEYVLIPKPYGGTKNE